MVTGNWKLSVEYIKHMLLIALYIWKTQQKLSEKFYFQKKDFKKLKRFIFKIPYFIFPQLETGTKFLAVKFNNYIFFYL